MMNDPIPAILLEVVENDNPHGRGWHLIESKPITSGYDYEHFGARQYARFESTSGTCGMREYKDEETGEVFWPATHCPHNHNHKYWADYFLNNGKWELGAN